MSHMPFAASASHRWMECPGSWYLSQKIPEKPAGQAAQVGTVVHQIIEECIKSRSPLDSPGSLPWYARQAASMDSKGNFTKWVRQGARTPNIPVTGDMVRGVRICLDLVNSIRQKRPNAKVFSELQTQLIAGKTGGTSDIVIVDSTWGAIIDYKNGRGHVNVEGNTQLQIYAAGVSALYPGVTDWTLCIVQPNDSEDPQPIRTWKTTTEDLNVFKSQVMSAVYQCEAVWKSPQETHWYKAGDHCRWCPGENQCVAKRKMALAALDDELPDLPETGVPQVKQVSELTDDQLVWVLKHRGMITQWLNESVTEEALKRIMDGREIPGFKTVERRTNRKITDPEGLENAARENGWEIWVEKIAALSVLDKEVPKKELVKYITKPTGEPELVPNSDKRKAIETKTELMKGLDNND